MRGARTWGDPNWSKAGHGPYSHQSLMQPGQNLRTLQEQFEFIEKYCRKPFDDAIPAPGVVPVAVYMHNQWVRKWRVARKNIRYRSLNDASTPGGGRISLAALRTTKYAGHAPKLHQKWRFKKLMHRMVFREATMFCVKWNRKINRLIESELIEGRKRWFNHAMRTWYDGKKEDAVLSVGKDGPKSLRRVGKERGMSVSHWLQRREKKDGGGVEEGVKSASS